ncbi:MAG TPA: dephospho-CoA kinase [Chitinispirillaceae bacterium]|nr:dephospho-CoA kinase [Chitinispirillaceae bacterium]
MASIRVGIAGYMGSGKTTCSKFFADAGALLINADAEAKSLMQSQPQIQNKLLLEFGDSISENGKISYSRLGSIVFSSKESLLRLNAIVHPPLLEKLRELMTNPDPEIIVLDAALIPLWNIDSWFDYRIWVDAPGVLRLDRIFKKNPNVTKELLQQRMILQESTFLPPSTKTWKYILNEDGIDMLSQKVSLVINQIVNRL